MLDNENHSQDADTALGNALNSFFGSEDTETETEANTESQNPEHQEEAKLPEVEDVESQQDNEDSLDGDDKKPSRSEKRIQELVAREKQAKEELERYRQEAEIARYNLIQFQQAMAAQQYQQHQNVDPDPEPEFNEFDPESVKNYVSWLARKQVSPLQQQLKQQEDFIQQLQAREVEMERATLEREMDTYLESEIPTHLDNPLHESILTGEMLKEIGKIQSECQRSGIRMSAAHQRSAVKNAVQSAKKLIEALPQAQPKVEVVQKQHRPIGEQANGQPMPTSKPKNAEEALGMRLSSIYK